VREEGCADSPSHFPVIRTPKISDSLHLYHLRSGVSLVSAVTVRDTCENACPRVLSHLQKAGHRSLAARRFWWIPGMLSRSYSVTESLWRGLSRKHHVQIIRDETLWSQRRPPGPSHSWRGRNTAVLLHRTVWSARNLGPRPAAGRQKSWSLCGKRGL
jgi:hypothetical protein